MTHTHQVIEDVSALGAAVELEPAQALVREIPHAATSSASSLLQGFAEVAERVAATTKKLEKAKLLGDYFKTLNDADLIRAARYFAGQTFAMNDQRTTNVGSSVLRNALSEVSKIAVDELRPRYVRLGDAGDVTFEVMTETNCGQAVASKTLRDTETLIERLSATRGTKNKLTVLIDELKTSTALEAKYLVKLLVGDLRIGLKEGLVEDAIARGFNRSLGDVAHANMLIGDIGETALRARLDELAHIEMRLFHPLKFMLATAAEDAGDVARTMTDGFYVEDKFDGIRGQAHIQNKRVELYSRSLDLITHRFPELIEPLSNLVTDAILDGEILPATTDKILPFAALQKRLGRKTVSEDLMRETPVVFVAYDVLYANEQVVTAKPLSERRALLESLIESLNGTVRLSDARLVHDVTTLDSEFDNAKARGNEGLMIKDVLSTYKPGKRGREWLKIKKTLATLDVVVTSVEVGHGKRRHLLSDYTFAVRRSAQDDELLNIGKAYSGLTDAELLELTEWFKQHTVQEYGHGKVRVVEPKIILEITFERVQKSARHKSGYALRFPRILRLRSDKTVDEIDTLDAVKALVDEDTQAASADGSSTENFVVQS